MPPTAPRGIDGQPLHGTPMCWRWYERAGDHRPWISWLEGCRCGVPGQALPEQHGTHCPIWQYHDRQAQGEDGPRVIRDAELVSVVRQGGRRAVRGHPGSGPGERRPGAAREGGARGRRLLR